MKWSGINDLSHDNYWVTLAKRDIFLLYYLNKTNPEFVYRQNSLKALENQVVEIISYLSEVKSTTEIDNLLYRNDSTVKNNQ